MQILQKILAFNLFLFLINYNFQLKYIYAYFFAVCIITRTSSQRHIGTASFFSSSRQVKSYYLTIDRSNFWVPAIRLRIKILLFRVTSFPISGLPTSELDFFRIYDPSPTRGRVFWEALGFDAWGYFATSPRNSTLSSGRSAAADCRHGNLNAMNFAGKR